MSGGFAYVSLLLKLNRVGEGSSDLLFQNSCFMILLAVSLLDKVLVCCSCSVLYFVGSCLHLLGKDKNNL